MEISFLVLLLLLNLIVTAARTGFLNIRPAKLLSLGENQNSKAARTIEIVSQQTYLRGSLKLTQNLLRISMVGLILADFSPWEITSLSTLSLILYLVGIVSLYWMIEFLVERLIIRHPESWAIGLTPVAITLVFIFSPLLKLLLKISRDTLSENGIMGSIDEEELQALIDASLQAGIIESDERQMITRIFELNETIAREIMIPRTDMLSLEVNTPFDEAAAVVLESGFSRVPIYENSIDEIVGILYTKDMLKIGNNRDHTNSLRTILRPAKLIPEFKKVDELLEEMQAEHIHIAIVMDEYGGVAGLVTLEDIVEEIFGEIQDEFDDAEELPFQKIGDGEFLFLGRIELDEFNEIMGADIQSNGADTLGGLIYGRLEREPKVGDNIVEGNLSLTIKEVGRHRVQKVHARWNV